MADILWAKRVYVVAGQDQKPDELSIEQLAQLAKEAVRDLKEYYLGGNTDKLTAVLTDLRRVLSSSEFILGDAEVCQVIPNLVQLLLFGSDSQLWNQAVWCLANTSAKYTKAVLPAVPFLLVHLASRSMGNVAEISAWALGNIACESEEFRKMLLSLGTIKLLPWMLFENNTMTVKAGCWALSNLIQQGTDPIYLDDLIKTVGLLPKVIGGLLRFGDDDLAREVAFLVLHLSTHSNIATLLAKEDAVNTILARLVPETNIPLSILLLKTLANIPPSAILLYGNEVELMDSLLRCLKVQDNTLIITTETVHALSNIANGSVHQKRLICSRNLMDLCLPLLSRAPIGTRKEVASLVYKLCCYPYYPRGPSRRRAMEDLLPLFAEKYCLRCFIDMVHCHSSDPEVVSLGIQFIEMVIKGMPKEKGLDLVKEEGGEQVLELLKNHSNGVIRATVHQLLSSFFA